MTKEKIDWEHVDFYDKEKVRNGTFKYEKGELIKPDENKKT